MHSAVFLLYQGCCVLRQSRRATVHKGTLFVMLNLSFALFLLNGFLLLSLFDNLTSDDDFCTSVAVILHFSLLSSLSWMMAEAIYLLIATAKVCNLEL